MNRGTLKTKADSESLQGKWFTMNEIKKMMSKNELRGVDFLQLVNDYRKQPIIPLKD
jgi:hypothetical protein